MKKVIGFIILVVLLMVNITIYVLYKKEDKCTYSYDFKNYKYESVAEVLKEKIIITDTYTTDNDLIKADLKKDLEVTSDNIEVTKTINKGSYYNNIKYLKEKGYSCR